MRGVALVVVVLVASVAATPNQPLNSKAVLVSQENVDTEESASKSKPTRAAEPVPTISKAFYLNLDHDTDRRAHMEGQLASLGMKYERVTGITPEEIDSGKYASLYPSGLGANTDGDYERQKRSAACDVAHRLVYQKISNEPDGLYLLLEDDVGFKEHWETEFAENWKDIPSDWQIARLGFWGDTDSRDEVPGTKWNKAVRHNWSDKKGEGGMYYYGAHAIVLDPSRARAFLDMIVNEPAQLADKFTGYDRPAKSYVLRSNIIYRTDQFGSTRKDGPSPQSNSHDFSETQPTTIDTTAAKSEKENTASKQDSSPSALDKSSSVTEKQSLEVNTEEGKSEKAAGKQPTEVVTKKVPVLDA